MNIQRYLLLFATLLSACQPEPAAEKAALAEIVNTHFAELPVMQELMPVMSGREWYTQKGFDIDKFLEERNKGQRPTTIPPAPPVDTVLYADALFEELVAEKVITQAEAAHFKQELDTAERGMQWERSDELNVTILPRAELYRRLEDGERRRYTAHRRFSVPLLSKDGRKVIVRVDELLSRDAGQGYTGVFEKRDGQWVEVFRKSGWMN